jgi:hypothetical protein
MSTNMRLNRTRKANLVVIAALGVVAAGGIANAAIPSADGVIHACYNSSSKPSGQLRVIDPQTGATCAKNETALNFNQQGPKGDKGLPGADGKDGLDGAPGVDGADGADGVDGLDGADGQNGAPGPAGTSAVFIARGAGFDGTEIFYQNSVSVSVSPGSYAISARGRVFNADGDFQSSHCDLSTGASVSTSGEGRTMEPFSLIDAGTFSGLTTIALSCHGFRAQGVGLVLSAIRVDAVNP